MAAPRNRTITLTPQERIQLEHNVLDINRMTDGTVPENSIIYGDMTEALNKLPDEFADLIILDPPYNLYKVFGTTTFKSVGNDDYLTYLNSWLPKVCRKLKPTGSLYLCGDWKCTAQIQTALEGQLHIMNRITWQREKGRGGTKNWKNCIEDIWFAVKDSKNYYFNVEGVKLKRRVIAPYRQDGEPKDWITGSDGMKFRLTHASNFWDDISIPFWSMPENTIHPTQKPEKLIAKLILASSKEKDMVFDPFLGSGTTAAVAKKLGRQFCGIEREKEYCLLAAKRLLLANSDKSIQGFKDGVFWERNTIQKR